MNLHFQPKPQKNSHKSIPELVIEDIQKVSRDGKKKYGTYLQPFNGRSSLVDLYEELLDAVQYLRQHIEETENKKP